MDSKLPVYTLEEVSKHNTIDDCWVILHGFVCNITNYLPNHPGGPKLVLQYAGSDATEAFEALYHSPRAKNIVKDHIIGVIEKKESNLLNPKNFLLKPNTQGYGPYGLYKSPNTNTFPAPPSKSKTPFDNIAFRSYKLLSIRKLNENTSIFIFEFMYKLTTDIPPGKHVVIGLLKDGKMIKRQYTPISYNKDNFELLVKRYDNGEISKYFHNLKLGDKVKMKGVFGNLTYKKNNYSHIFMFAAGTGITPMYSLIKHIINDDEDKTFVHLVFANRTEEDILLKESLDEFTKHKDKFVVQYILSSPKTSQYKSQRVNQEVMNSIKEKYDQQNIISNSFSMVCGPDSFCENVKSILISSWNLKESQVHVF